MQYNFDKGEKFFLLYRTRIVIKIKIMINYRDFPKPLFAKVSQRNDIKKSSFYKNYLTRDFQSRQMCLCVDVSLRFPFSDCKTDGHPRIAVTHTNQSLPVHSSSETVGSLPQPGSRTEQRRAGDLRPRPDSR